jgi:hypothetical protein
MSLQAENASRSILDCTFDGPYYQRGSDTIQTGCTNNYEWGKKDLGLSIDHPADGSGASQRFDIRGISSGAMQFFVTGFAIKRGYYYKVSFRAKGELGGQVATRIRRIGKPWKTVIPGLEFTTTSTWKRYTFTGKGPTDVDSDIGLMFQTGSLGQLWIDDVKIEEFEEAPDSIRINRNPLVHGNLMPRSSFEGKVDYLWTSGIYAGPEGEWEDPQIYRAKDGKFGTYALAIPTTKTKGMVFCRSFWIPVAAGHPYTFSAVLKGSKPGAKATMQIFSRQGSKNLGSQRLQLTENWQRFSVTSKPIPDDVTEVYISFSASENNGTLLVDGTQLEAGKKAAPYTPAYPVEIYADTSGYRSNIFFWDEALRIKIRAAGAQNRERGRTVKTRVSVTAFPDITVIDKVLDLPLNHDYPLTIDSDLNGLFRVRFEPVDSELAAPQEILLARLPHPREVGPSSSFGTHITVRPFFIDYAKRIGMKWTRFHDATLITKWKHAESTPGHYRYCDKQVDAILAAGMNILGLPDYPPAWAKIKNAKDETVIDLDAYAKLCQNLAAHYKGKIDYWEVWNEPYMKYFFPGNPKQYGDLLAVGAKAFRAGNPSANILGFCTEINDLAYAEKIPRETRNNIDILSFHCYFQNLTGGGNSGYEKEVNEYLNFLKPVTPREVWNTEGGNRELGINSFYSFMPAAEGKLNERAAAFGARVWVEQRKGGIDKLFIYTLHQSDTIMYYGGYKKLIGFDRSVTPAAVSTAVTAWCIDGLKNIPLNPQAGTVQGLFGDEKRCCWVAFDDSAVTGHKTLHLDKLPSGVHVIDSMGNAPAGNRVAIGIMPYFAYSETLNPQKLAATCRQALR